MRPTPISRRNGATRAAVAVLTLALAACTGGRDPASPSATSAEASAAERGMRLAQAGCASCHAVGLADASALPAAPPFRDVASRRDLAALEADFAQGLVTAHPDMPPFVWRAA